MYAILFPLETRQQTKRGCDFLPGHIRFVGKRAEECNAATLLNGVGDREVECFPEALDRSEDIEQRPRPLVSAGPGHNVFQFTVVEIKET